MLASSLWFSLSFASSIICFISSALGAALVVVVLVAAGLDAVVVVVVAGLEAVVVAGLETEGTLGEIAGVCPSAIGEIANRTISDFRNFFIRRRVWPGAPRNVKPVIYDKFETFYYFRWLSKRRDENLESALLRQRTAYLPD